MLGYAFCGSFCTHAASLAELEKLTAAGEDILPIMSDTVYETDTRFGKAKEFVGRVTELCGKDVIHTIKDAEPLGPKITLEALIVAPCTGNTLSKMARGITDTPVTMAAKAHMRCNRPLLIALASNDAMFANLSSISVMLQRKSVYFVPLRQDDPVSKPHSLVADFSKLGESLAALRRGEQLRPLFV